VTFQAPVRPPLSLRELVRRYVMAVKEANPGVKVVEIAKLLGTAPATLYRIIRGQRVRVFGPKKRRGDDGS
jgi:hypothetical protein